ncbi:MAG TPA: glutaminyl-peptide cyclotransferase [Pyrinomonadaceae bacterium]|nr:glutaminyl-peptide cyclotransferase [Pyrinomonadaceae bacterium]
MAKKTTTKPTPPSRRTSKAPVIILVAVIAVAALVAFLVVRPGTPAPSASSNANRPTANVPAKLDAYEIVNDYPHDPQAFLQGLVWYDSGFYEGTGLEGRSTLRRVEFPSGRVVKSVSLARDLFGEGVALVGDRLVQLTWTTQRGFVYDRDSFKLLREFKYDTEGWGITYDGKNLVMSDGTSTLTYLDPETFQPVRRVNVTWNGRPQDQLNELEYIEGEIWSNVWQTNYILRIDPETGRVKSFLDLKNLLAPQLRTGSEDVLNGIAYDPQTKRIFVSGKLWPRIFEIRVK